MGNFHNADHIALALFMEEIGAKEHLQRGPSEKCFNVPPAPLYTSLHLCLHDAV